MREKFVELTLTVTVITVAILGYNNVKCEELSEASLILLNNSIPTKCPLFNDGPVVHIAHEWNCTLFYKCDRSEKVLQECPKGLHFNAVLQLCDWPNHANCHLIERDSIVEYMKKRKSTTNSPRTTRQKQTRVPKSTTQKWQKPRKSTTERWTGPTKSTTQRGGTRPPKSTTQRWTKPRKSTTQRETRPTKSTTQRGTRTPKSTTQRWTKPRKSTTQRETRPTKSTTQRGTRPPKSTTQRWTKPRKSTTQRGTRPPKSTTQRWTRPPKSTTQRWTRPPKTTTQRGTRPTTSTTQIETTPTISTTPRLTETPSSQSTTPSQTTTSEGMRPTTQSTTPSSATSDNKDVLCDSNTSTSPETTSKRTRPPRPTRPTRTPRPTRSTTSKTTSKMRESEPFMFTDDNEDNVKTCIGSCPVKTFEDYPLYLPNEQCSKFCVCTEGRLFVLPCPPNMHFNREKRVCDFSDLAKCSDEKDNDNRLNKSPIFNLLKNLW